MLDVEEAQTKKEELRESRRSVEGENTAYKTRIDNLQEQVSALDNGLEESREELRSTTAAHMILITRIIRKGGFDFSDVPT